MSTIKVDTVRPVTADASLTLQGDNSGTGVSGITIDSSGNATFAGTGNNVGTVTAGTFGSSVDIKAAINASGSAPIYACRAWVNFRGTSQSGTLNTSGPVTGLYTATVTGATTFTIEYSSTTYTVTTSGDHDVGDGEGVDLTISGTSVTIDTQIRGSGNVSSIEDGGTGIYVVNLTTAMPDANYSVTATGMRNSTYAANANTIVVGLQSNTTYTNNVTTSGFSITTHFPTDATNQDPIAVCISVFR